MNGTTNKDSRWHKFILIVLLITLFYALLDAGGGNIESKEFLTVVLWGFVLLALIKSDIKIPVLPSIFAIGFFLWGIFSTLFTYSPDMSLRALLGYGAIGGTAILSFLITTNENREKLITIFSTTSAAMVLIGYFFLMGARFGVFEGRHDMLQHFISTFFWKNPAAGYIAMWLPIIFFLWRTSKKAKLLWGILLALSSCALILTRSRGGWLAFVIAIVLSAPFGWQFIKKHIKPAVIITILALALSLLVMPPKWVLERFVQMKEIAQEKVSEPVEERRAMLRMALRAIQKSPITGVGIGAFLCAYPSLLESSHYLSRHLHNQYLQVAVETGVLGMMLFSLMIFVTIGTILISARKKLDFLLWAIGTGTLAFAIHLSLDFDWEFWGTSLPFATMLGIGIANNSNSITISGIKRGIAIAIASLCFFLSALVYAAGTFNTLAQKRATLNDINGYLKWSRLSVKVYPLSATYRVRLADVLSLIGNKDEAVKQIEKAYSLEPNNPLLCYSYGYALIESDTAQAISILEKANSISPYSLPDKKLGYARFLISIEDYNRAENILKTILRNFSTNPNERYSEKTSSIKYYVAQSANELGYIYLSRNDYRRADSLFRLVQVLGCPRPVDKIAYLWVIDTPSPEAVVVELYDALNVGDTLRAWSLIKDEFKPMLADDEKIYPVQILESHQNMIQGKAKVQVLLAHTKDNHQIRWNMAEFKLVLTESGWKLLLGE